MTLDVPSLRLYAPDPIDSQAQELATLELLRPASERGGGRDLEPYSRAWFEELEQKRYARAGVWLPRILEFSRHRDESLLMLGPGLGSDALQYQRHGTSVTIAVTPSDPIGPLQRNLSYRGLDSCTVSVETASQLPFATGQFDLAYFNALSHLQPNLSEIVTELFRVLKAGGKLFLLAPARYDVDFWQRWILPYRPLYHDGRSPFAGIKCSRQSFRMVLAQFETLLIQKRHLRRSELPRLWRAFPLSLLERLTGRILVVRATKPIRAAKLQPLMTAA